MNPLAMLLAGAHGPAGPVIHVGGGGPPDQGPPQGGDPSDQVRQIIDQIHAFIGSVDDDQDKAIAAKCLQAFQQILATEQKEQEAAMGTTPAHKFLRKATAGPSY